MRILPLFIIQIFSLLGIFYIFYHRKKIISQAKNEEKPLKKEEKSKISNEEKPLKKEFNSKPSYTSKNISKHLKRAEILIEHQEENEAEKILVAILAELPQQKDCLNLLSSIYLQKKQFLRAENLLREIISLEFEKKASTLSNLAYSLYEQNKFNDAIIYYKKALKIDTNNYKRYTNLGQVLFVVKEFDEAIELFKQAYKLKPRDTNILFMLADTCKTAQKYKEALENYQKILDYEPYNEDARSEVRILENLVIKT
jgi:tetratricopeptide (TPR) repeat protein